MGRTFFVYILSSLSGTLYVGLTDNLEYRLWQHRKGVRWLHKEVSGQSTYVLRDILNNQVAEKREKQIKAYRRAKKIALFEPTNPEWRDLTKEVFPVL